MKNHPGLEEEFWCTSRHAVRDDEAIQRANARLRHFRGVAAGVMAEAQSLWREIWESLQDSRSPDEILEEGEVGSRERSAGHDMGFLLERLHLLGIQIDYARRLCEGAIGNELHE